MNTTAILTTQELANYMKLNEKTILKMAQNKDIPGIKVGSQWRFHLDAINRYLQKDQIQTPDDNLETRDNATDSIIPLSRLFDVSIINLDMKADSREDVLQELSRNAAAAGIIDNAEKLYTELAKREQMLSTAAGNGIAIPHPRNPDPAMFKKANILLGRSQNGIDFDAPDNKKVHLFFMTCAPSIAIHLKLLTQLSKILHVKGAINKFMTLPTDKEIIQFLLKIERKNLFSWESIEKE